jgi:hypothetical protein
MSRFPKLITFILLFVLSACSPNLAAPMETAVTPTFTPWVAGTETAQAFENQTELPNLPSPTFTPWVEGTQTALAVATQNALPTLPPPMVLPTFPSPTTVPGAMEKPTDFSPVLYGKKYDANTFFLLLGGVRWDGWLAPEVSTMRFSGEATYSLHTLQQGYKYFFWGKAPVLSPTCGVFTVGTDIDVNEAGMVAVLDGWNVTKRVVTELPADAKFYQQAATDWLAGEGVASAQIGLLQIFRVDIEGDGTDEVFISAAHLDESQHTTKAGDYSIVLMRRVVGNDVVTTPIVADVYRSKGPELTFPRIYSLANFIDLNQDGVLEVVVEIQGWEKFGAIVFQVNGQQVIQSLCAEC